MQIPPVITLPWLIQNKAELANILTQHQLMVEGRWAIVKPGTSGGAAFQFADNCRLVLPIKLASLADSTATAASVSTQLNALLAALRAASLME